MGPSDLKILQLGNALMGTGPNPLTTFLGSAAQPPGQRLLLGSLYADPKPAVKRRAYFAFDFDDVMRVNNVRQAWRIGHPDSALYRTFYDSSLWESRKLEGDDALKRLMREGVEHTSAVCVLVGTATWASRWVRYEIARAVIDGRGLLSVHINGLNHHQRRLPDALGFNPLSMLAVGPTAPSVYHLFERKFVKTNFLTGAGEWQWHRYGDHKLAVAWPRYLTMPQVGWVMPLSSATADYDFVASAGHMNLGSWIDRAAIQAGR